MGKPLVLSLLSSLIGEAVVVCVRKVSGGRSASFSQCSAHINIRNTDRINDIMCWSAERTQAGKRCISTFFKYRNF